MTAMKLTHEQAQILVGLLVSARNTAAVELRMTATGSPTAPYPDPTRAAYLVAVIDLANAVEAAYHGARAPIPDQFRPATL